MTPPYPEKDIREAKALRAAKKVGALAFSEGTYQVEVKDLKQKKSWWPFLQLDDAGRVLDGFCNCPAAEKKKSCPHLAGAYLAIFAGHDLPVHVRFRGSLWNQLGQIACRRHGPDPKVFKAVGKGFEAVSSTGKKLFSVEGHKGGKKQLEELLFNRAEETEETSLKFSNLPPEEILLWREGRPSQQLIYELSFWSDLAKWWMQLQDGEEEYEITFSNDGLPKWAYVKFPQVSFQFYIAEANWPQIIPALATVDSPLPVFELQHQKIEAIRYDRIRHSFLLEVTPLKGAPKALPDETKDENRIVLGEWTFVPDKGFFPSRFDPIFNEKEIPEDKVASTLRKHPEIIQKYLKETKVHPGSVKAKYQVYFDSEDRLHISCYLFEEGDLQKPMSHFFGPWVFLDGKGFYLLEDLLFEGVEKVIARNQVSEFVNRHRVWLNGFEGFQTHVSSIESQLTFSVSKEGFLHFESGLEIVAEGGEFVDFGEWVYLKGKGFFAKRVGRTGTGIRLGMTIHRSEINAFIRSHRDELEYVKGFFSSTCPLEKCGLEIFLNADKRIVVRPHFQFLPNYQKREVVIFGDYAYVPGEGFAEIPYDMRLPEGYTREKIITIADEPYFVAYELEALAPFISSIQKQLQKGRELFVRVNKIQQASKAKGKEWLIDMTYESELGSVGIHEVWKAQQENKRYIFTECGLIILKHARFNWMKTVHKKKWLKEGKVLRMTTMDWLRLCVFDDLRPPQGKESSETRKYIEELTSFNMDLPIDLTGLKSDLRSYQEVGVKWLWFLYSHGLSGLLCDEMGLGKTHQAMGLIAAAKNQERGKKYLVVCPTSVIYHWQELLKNFLPDVNVFIFYGIGRKLEAFRDEDEVLLTSYGTMRSEKKALSKIEFDLAIFDEVQTAKNIHSQTHKAMKILKAKMRLGLTGTPIENRLLELKALFDVVVPGYMPSDAHFKEMFVNPIEKNQDPEKKALLSRFIRHFILRRKKSEVLLELPEKIEEISYCDLSDEQAELYRRAYLQQKESLLQDLEDKSKPVPYLHVFALLTTLKQICDHPCLITKKFEDFQKHRSGKWELFVELLQEVRDSGQKLVVFSQYLEMLNMIERYLTENNIGFSGIRGSTRDRKAQLERFRDDPTSEVFVASLQAVGVGVDLVSASVVIHYDRWWNPARENQATDRVHRIGQNRGVQVFKLVTKGTIEEHIHRLIEKKLALMEGVLGFDDQDHLKGLDRQELLELLWLIDRDLNQ